MKKIIAAVSFLLLFTLSSAQENVNVPASVKTAFTKKFANARKVKWEKEDHMLWEASFEMNGKKYSANFDSDGKWKETEYKIKKSELPELIITSLKSEFNDDYEFESAEVAETPDGKVYEIKIEVDEEEIEVVIDENGSILKKEELEDQDEEHSNDDEDIN